MSETVIQLAIRFHFVGGGHADIAIGTNAATAAEWAKDFAAKRSSESDWMHTGGLTEQAHLVNLRNVATVSVVEVRASTQDGNP